MVTTDTLVENVDFRRHWISAQLLGRKALAVSLSDLAAKGAQPVAFLMNAVVPASLAGTYFKRLAVGVLAAAEAWQVPLVGGDLSGGEQVQITVTALGNIDRGEAMLRSDAKPGDWIFLIGQVGWSRLGLEMLRQEDPDFSNAGSDAELNRRAGGQLRSRALSAHLIPQPLIEAGRWLQQSGLVHAAIDVSDGLASDLHHIIEESYVGAELDLAAVLPEEAPIRGAASSEELLEQAVLDGGEDYALLITVPADRAGALTVNYPADLPPPIPVGRITAGNQLLVKSRQGVRPYVPQGFDHFK